MARERAGRRKRGARGPVALAVLLGIFASVAPFRSVDAGGEDPAEGERLRWQVEIERLGLEEETVVYPFTSTPEMVEWAREAIRPARNGTGEQRLEALQDRLFDDDFHFVYDQNLTLPAPEAFEGRRGNCMAFTSMFVALARGVGISATLVSVRREPSVTRHDGLVIVNRHVVAGLKTAGTVALYDFSLRDSEQYSHRQIVDDVRASAMFHANIGGGLLRSDRLEEAAREFHLATRLAPDWAPGWLNLGVTRFRLGNVEAAMDCYRRALEEEPGNSSVLTNLAVAHQALGNEEAARTALAAAAGKTRNPFTLIAMANLEMRDGNLKEARSLLRRARWWYGDEPEVYLALARLAMMEGDGERAEDLVHKADELRAASEDGND